MNAVRGVNARGDHPVGGDESLYFDARVASTDLTSPYAAPAPDQIFLRHGLDSGLGEGQGNLPPGTFVLHRFAGHGDRVFDRDTREYDLTLGVEGRLGAGIGYDAHVRSYLWDVCLDGGTFVRRSAILQAISDGRYNLADPLSTDPDHLDAIGDSGVRLSNNEFTKHRVARVAFDGTGFELGGGALDWAAGVELVHQSRQWDPIYRDASGNVVDPVDVAGSSPFRAISFQGERERMSEFAEVWMGHDLAVRWRDAFDIGGVDITGGIMNVSDRGPSINADDPEDPDETLDSIRGRTVFLTVKRTW